jgi:hypothetical protein
VSYFTVQVEGYPTLTEGQRVSFVWRGGTHAHGRHVAEEVRVAGEEHVSVNERPIKREGEDTIVVEGKPVDLDTDSITSD